MLDWSWIQVYHDYMNKLSNSDRARILHMLCEGNSIRSITRIMGVAKLTVTRLLIDAGTVCAAYHDQNVRNVKAQRVGKLLGA